MLHQQEIQIMNKLKEAMKSGKKLERTTQPAIVVENKEPPDIPELKMGDLVASPFTGEDAVRYLAGLSLSNREVSEGEGLEGVVRDEGEGVVDGGRGEVEGKEDVGEPDVGGHEAGSDQDQSESGLKSRKDSQPMKGAGSSPASSPQAEAKSWEDERLELFQEIERDNMKVIKEAADTLNRNQTPVKREAKVYSIPGRRHKDPDRTPPTKETTPAKEATPTNKTLPRSDTPNDKLTDKSSGGETTPPKRPTLPKHRRTREEIHDEELRRRFPGIRPWPTLEECEEKQLPKTVVFTSTWLSVTAKGVQ